MLSCKKATMLIEKKVLFGLSWKENIQLRLHKSMCDACTTYEKQSKLLDKLLHKHIDGENFDHIPTSPNEPLKERIINKLQ